MTYQLIAFDMDGTLLRSDKTFSGAVLSSIRTATQSGKELALATGRPVTELFPYEKELADFRYAVLESGALVYDLTARRILIRHTLDANCIGAVLDAIRREDVMPQAMSAGASYVNAGDLHRMDYYHMGIYETLYERSATCVPSMEDFIQAHASEIEKINLYHATPEGRERTFARLSSCQVERTFAEQTSLEISPPGIHKGSGLLDLCGLLHLSPEETIAVGDADNDIPMLRTAGLGIAMGNAAPNVRAAADVLVAGNDEDGCAEAIDRYLLG